MPQILMARLALITSTQANELIGPRRACYPGPKNSSPRGETVVFATELNSMRGHHGESMSEWWHICELNTRCAEETHSA